MAQPPYDTPAKAQGTEIGRSIGYGSPERTQKKKKAAPLFPQLPHLSPLCVRKLKSRVFLFAGNWSRFLTAAPSVGDRAPNSSLGGCLR